MPDGTQRRDPDPTEGTPSRRPLVRVETRDAADYHRSSPRMRFDVLQIAAWGTGLVLIVLGLVAIARAGFDELGLFAPVVVVAGLPANPLFALVWILIGLLLLVASTGDVDERGLRITGIVLAVIGVVWMIESAAFEPFLGVSSRSGTAFLVKGLVVGLSSFVPPLSIARPGVPPPENRWRV